MTIAVTRFKFCFLAALFLTFAFILPSTPLLAQFNARPDSAILSSPSPPVPCNNPEGDGAIFNDFKKLVIYYMDYPHPHSEKCSEYPDLLKYTNFNERLLQEVRKNFSLCLQTPSGEAKPIVVVPPPMRATDDKSIERDTLAQQEAKDPANLIIVISVRYKPNPHPDEMKVGNVGLARFDIHRPGFSGYNALPLVRNKSAGIVLSPKLQTDFPHAQLEQFFKAIKPSSPLGWDKIPPSPHGPRTIRK